jgi:cytochrome b involved in lipid metabolism
MTTISLAELEKHKTREDCWIAIDGNVYDVSKFHEEHPGEGINAQYIAHYSGKIVDDLFEKYHSNDEPFEWLEEAKDGKHKLIFWKGKLEVQNDLLEDCLR